MILNIEKGDLFKLDNEKYVYAHCISLDCNMGKGIAKTFDKKFNGMKSFLINKINGENYDYPKTIPCFSNGKLRVFNLITKEKYWNKPTYSSLESCIRQMAEFCARHDVKYLAIPKLGCGLDRLQWGKVQEIIYKYFYDLDITIEVRYL